MRGKSVHLVCPAHTAGSRSLGLSDLVIHSLSITRCCQPSRYRNIAPCQLDLDRSQGQGCPHVADDSKWGEQNLWHILTWSDNKPLVESSPPDSYLALLVHFRKVIVSVGQMELGLAGCHSHPRQSFQVQRTLEFSFPTRFYIKTLFAFASCVQDSSTHLFTCSPLCVE